METLQIKLSPSGAICKEDFIAIWEHLDSNQVIEPDPIYYKHEGSTIDEDGIRICGTIKFIQQVLSNLTQMLRFDNHKTRLGIACSQLTDRYSGKVIKGKFRCSIQVHERGKWAKMFTPREGDYRNKHTGKTIELCFN